MQGLMTLITALVAVITAMAGFILHNTHASLNLLRRFRHHARNWMVAVQYRVERLEERADIEPLAWPALEDDGDA